MNPSVCPIHQQPWKTVPGGVSRSKFDEAGNPKTYAAFQACPVKGCDQRPPKAQAYAPPAATPAARPSVQPNSDAQARLEAACAAWSGACAFYAGQPAAVPGFVEAMALTGYQFITKAHRGLPMVQREPGEDADLDALFGPPTEVVG